MTWYAYDATLDCIGIYVETHCSMLVVCAAWCTAFLDTQVVFYCIVRQYQHGMIL